MSDVGRRPEYPSAGRLRLPSSRHRRLILAIGVSLATLACHTSTPIAPVAAKSSTTPVPRASAAVLVHTDIDATLPASAKSVLSPSPAVATPAVLQAPTGTTLTLAGHVTLDQATLQGRGDLALTSGGNAVSGPPGSTLLSDNGGSLTVGGSVVALASGNAIPDAASGVNASLGGAALVDADGRLVPSGGILSNNGAGVVSNNGGGILSNNGGGIVSNNAGARRVLDLAVPQALPVAGALVSAVSLKTRTYLPVGVDKQGKPVYSVFTDLAGGYKLYLGSADPGNVVIAVGAAPKASNGVQLDAVTPASTTTSVQVNEDTDMATRLVRGAFATDMAQLLTSNDANIIATNLGTGAATPALEAMVTLINGRAVKDGVPQGADAANLPAVRELASIMTDALLGTENEDQLQIASIFTSFWTGPNESISSALTASVKALRVQTADYLSHHPAPATVTYVQDSRDALQANMTVGRVFCPDHLQVPIATDTDFARFALDRFVSYLYFHSTQNLDRAYAAVADPAIPLAQIDAAFTVTGSVLDTAANPDVYTDPTTHQALHYSQRIAAAVQTETSTIATAMSGPDAATFQQPLLAALDGYVSTHKFTATPAPQASSGLVVTPCAGATGATAASGATTP